MSPVAKDCWDLTPAIDLIYSLSTASEGNIQHEICSTFPNAVAATPINHQPIAQLGNFDKLWQFLGQPSNLPPPNISSERDNYLPGVVYSNGNHTNAPLKVVKWRDQIEGADLADDDEKDDKSSLTCLTKGQRKIARWKQRQLEGSTTPINPSDSESESKKEVSSPQRLNSQAVLNEILYGQLLPDKRIGRTRSGKVFRQEISDNPVSSPVAAAKPAIRVLKPVEVTHLANSAERKVQLLTKLQTTFIEEHPYLSNLSYSQYGASCTSLVAEGIHVFVDASNIMIGFSEALKMSRGQYRFQRIRRQPLSFHNLSLILERGRPTAKRILVGSDSFPAIIEAKEIGYETNILDRVHKAKELAPRQRKFSTRDHRNSTSTSTGSGSETTAAAASVQYAPEKWVEQAVDEILHLKMMESVVDADEPSIMVLATGDAAEAEYSEGFLKMVDRALGKGWKVELVSFRHNTSGAYKRREFRQKWGERFKIVELDDFVELLLGEE